MGGSGLLMRGFGSESEGGLAAWPACVAAWEFGLAWVRCRDTVASMITHTVCIH